MNNPFTTLHSEKVRTGRFTIVQDRVRVNGKEQNYDYLEIREGVCILPQLKNKLQRPAKSFDVPEKAMLLHIVRRQIFVGAGTPTVLIQDRHIQSLVAVGNFGVTDAAEILPSMEKTRGTFPVKEKSSGCGPKS